MYRLIGLLMAVGLVLGVMPLSWAQPAPSPPPRPPAPVQSMPPGQPTPTVSGTVQQYLLTPHGEVEGLLLADGTIVRFPPHLSAALASTVKPGDAVTVAGFLMSATGQGQTVKALTITNTATGQTVADQPPASRPLPPELRGLTLTPLTVRGTVARLVVNDHGDVDGLILSSGEHRRSAACRPDRSAERRRDARPCRAAPARACLCGSMARDSINADWRDDRRPELMRSPA